MDNDMMMGPLVGNIIDLANKLRQERLFVVSEQQHLQKLNDKVVSVSSQLAELAWVTAQQRDNLNALIVARPDCSPASCCQKANSLENTRFVDAVKVLGFQECMSYGEFLQVLRQSPALLASCLATGDRVCPDAMHAVVHSLAAGLFGSILLHEDMTLVLRLLQNLARLQLVPSDNPRRLLRKRCCAFARLYGEFHESLFSAKLFLTAALHEPIMQLLVDHDIFLDIDPDKATVRFSPEDRLKKFGVEGTAEYAERLAKYRAWSVGRLVAITSRFLASLRENVHCFPVGVCWLVRQMASMLAKSGSNQPKEVSAICTDVVFTHFICPAIVNPEPYGITDAPISYISRFNLIQVATIIQTLAMTRYEEIDPKLADLYSQFDKDCVSCLLDSILSADGDDLEDSLSANQDSLQGLTRSSALFTESELQNLVSFFRTVSSDDSNSCVDKKELDDLLRLLPAPAVPRGSPAVSAAAGGSATPPQGRKITGLLGKVGKSKNRHSNGDPCEERVENEDVLVIPFSANSRERVGFLPEHKVLCMEQLECSVQVNLPDPAQPDGTDSTDKRTRAMSHDDGSIGNTSDNLEAVSEAASNHSVASSLELETEDQNDNLSDMVSANVSGRGTPNISGRDTPSSQITEGDEGAAGARGGTEPRQLDFHPPSVNKQSRSDIDDKFCKFEIKKLLEGDETVMSMVSDTWSTDVLASDSETVEQCEPPLLVEPASAADETASEAWSTDVAPSDSERLTEVDTDDAGSVARSDDVATEEPAVNIYGGSGFRPIRDSPLFVPASPTRSDSAAGVAAASSAAWNVTGRGGAKADYRRRVVEYVDSNRRDRENQPNLAKPTPREPVKPVLEPNHLASASTQTNGDLMPPPSVPRPSLSLVNGPVPLVNGDPASLPRPVPVVRQPVLDANDNKVEVVCDEADGARLSYASAASSSSGSEPPAPAPPAPIANGHVKQAPLSTGAIPKSISFDKTAERGDKESLDEDQKQKRSFFRNFKLSFKNRRGKGLMGPEARFDSSLGCGDGPLDVDTTDDILAKYRRKPAPPAAGTEGGGDAPPAPAPPMEDARLAIDPMHVERSYAFADAKRKLRMVLSTADLQHRRQQSSPAGDLVVFLQLQLAEAINLQDRALVAHLHETLRCVRLFDAEGRRKLLASLREDYAQRSPYIAYLVRSRQGLLSTLAHLDRLCERVKSDRDVCSRFLVALCVSMFLERRDAFVKSFLAEFEQLTPADEKLDLMDRFLQRLALEMDQDATWTAASEAQMALARAEVNRAMMSRVYVNALYPNGDGDISRDQVLHEHMAKLSRVVTPNHKDLRIPTRFQYECPWASAQAEVAAIAAYKTPGDKLQCVLRCAATIMNLLAMADCPAADDFTPVLVYVLVKANPPSLLSTIQYVESFYGHRLEGEDQYWWTQFCSAVEFIKTMDYTD